MDNYRTRSIKFLKLHQSGDWQVKIYTISKEVEFNFPEFFNFVKDELPNWLEMKNGFESRNDKHAFVILHQGTEGVFSIINWWVGKNMLNTNIFFSEYSALNKFEKISGKGLAPCIWELEVINHERISWIYNILKQSPNPNFKAYLTDVYNGEM